MQPHITRKPWARATAIMRIASRRDPHLASLILIPSTAPTNFGISVDTTHDSSAITGIGERSRTKRSPSRSCGASGCSSISTPTSVSGCSMPRACFAVHAALASTRSAACGASSRTMRSTSRSQLEPSLILRIGYAAASRTRARNVSASGAIPMVKVERGAAVASSPHSFHNGTPSRLAATSCSAALMAQRAAAFQRNVFSKLCSIASIDQPSTCAITGANCAIAAITLSAVSP